MSRVLGIERVAIALHGVSAAVAEAAAVDLEEELARRLGSLVGRALVAGDLGMIDVRVTSGEGPLDPPALRALIAERLAFALSSPHAHKEADQ
jgi:hypothetical protein